MILTLVILVMLVMDVAHGGILFGVGATIALTINYKSSSLINERLDGLAADCLASTLAAGVLAGSGMAAALATSL